MIKRVFGKRILIKPEEVAEKYGVLDIPKETQEDKTMGEVVMLGNEIDAEVISIGDKILYSRFSGVDVDIKGDRYKVVHFDDILISL